MSKNVDWSARGLLFMWEFVCMCVTVCPGYTLKMNKQIWNIQPVWKKEKKPKTSQISRQCVGVNYAGKQLVNGVSVSEELTFPQRVFRVKIIFLLKVKQPCPIKNSAYLNTLSIDRAVQRWNTRLCAYQDSEDLYRSPCERNQQRYMHLQNVAFVLIR